MIKSFLEFQKLLGKDVSTSRGMTAWTYWESQFQAWGSQEKRTWSLRGPLNNQGGHAQGNEEGAKRSRSRQVVCALCRSALRATAGIGIHWCPVGRVAREVDDVGSSGLNGIEGPKRDNRRSEGESHSNQGGSFLYEPHNIGEK